ncbi:MAG: hypothetical protein HYV07_09100 [Deltaproteobacteria bacterium]|nr:hypothetical protein [Deltaproteobacteria bacterium]
MRLAVALLPLLLAACSKAEDPDPPDAGTTPRDATTTNNNNNNNNDTCTSDSNCSGSKPFCGASNACVACRGYNEGCPSGYVCNPSGRCGACATANCPSERPYCALDEFGTTICVQCVDDSACEAGFKPFCDQATNTCVECRDTNDCQDPTNACVELKACTEHVCHDTACQSDAQCVAACSLPICADGNCGECRTNADCAGARTCVLGFGNAKLCSICANDMDCPSTHPKCEGLAGICCTEGGVTSRECINCRDNNDCLSTQTCENRGGVTRCYDP